MKSANHETVRSDIVYKGYIDLKVDRVKRESHEGSFTYIVPHSDAACVLAITKDNRWVVIEEYRHPVNQYLLSLPGGAMEAGEAPSLTAKRELLEETGYDAGEFIHLGSLPPFPALCSQMIHFILALGAYQVATPTLEPFEAIEPLLLTTEEIDERIASGTNVDGIFCTGWLLQKTFLSRSQEKSV